MTISWEQVAQSGIVILLGLAVWWLVVRQGKRAVERVASNTDSAHAGEYRQRIDTLWALVRRIAQLVLWLVVLLTLALIWGVPATPFLAVGTTIGVAVGFGAQSVVSDVIAGFLIVSEHQFDIGDVVSVAGVSGSVEDVRLRVTVLRDLEGVVHYIPNGEIKVSSNFTQEYSRLVLDLGIGYECDVDTALVVLEEELSLVALDERWLRVPVVEVLGVNELASSAVILRAVLTTDPDDRWTAKREALRRVKLRFDAEGISIPFQQVALHVSGPVQGVLSDGNSGSHVNE